MVDLHYLDDEKEEYDDDGDIYQHASALVGELGPLYCPQSPLVLIKRSPNEISMSE